jgi:MYXO-CTERM domain-containing protein
LSFEDEPTPQHGVPVTTTGDTGLGTDVTGATTGATDTDTTGAASATDTDTDGSGTDTDGITSAIETLDWGYVCSGFMAPASSSGRISGLQNGVEYHVLVVAYDKAGNPAIASPVLTAIPRETTDFWEQCEQQGGICGEGGFCNCRASEPAPEHDAAWLLLLGLFGLRRRRTA